MFFVVVSRVKDKVLLIARLVLVMCVLSILIAQLYGVLKNNWIEHGKITNVQMQVEQHMEMNPLANNPTNMNI